MKSKHLIYAGILCLCATLCFTGCKDDETDPCTPATVQTLQVSQNAFCPGGGVTFSLSGTQDGVSYQLYKNGNPEGILLVGTGAPANFSGTYGTGTYTAKSVGTPQYCETDMIGSQTITTYAIFNAGAIATTGQSITTAETPNVIASTTNASGGDGNITYSWYKDGVVIDGATAETYTPVVTGAGTFVYTRKANDGSCFTAPVPSDGSYTLTVVLAFSEPGTTTTFADFNPKPDAATGSWWKLKDTRETAAREYKVVKMPDGRIWMAQNLNFQEGLTFQENSNEPFTTTNGYLGIGSFWAPASGTTGGASGVISTTSSLTLCNTYGALYNWETAMMVDGKYSDDNKTASGPDAWSEAWVSANYFAWATAPSATNNGNINNARSGHGICPKGWHVPTDYEWAVMLDKVNGDGTGTDYVMIKSTGSVDFINNATAAGARLKSVNVSTSSTPDAGTDTDAKWKYDATHSANNGDIYGFNVIPAGQRGNAGGDFRQRGNIALYWSSTPYNDKNIYVRTFSYSTSFVSRASSSGRGVAASVRCIKDSE